MNIFILSLCVVEAAKQYMWKHCIKIILEICQMMSAYLTEDEQMLSMQHGIVPYKRTHAKHPMTLWVNRSMNNYLWAGNMALALCQRYTEKYGKKHCCEDRVRWLMRHVSKPMIQGEIISTCGHTCCTFDLTPIPLCMPDQYKVGLCPGSAVSSSTDPVRAYQRYYVSKRNAIQDYT